MTIRNVMDAADDFWRRLQGSPYGGTGIVAMNQVEERFPLSRKFAVTVSQTIQKEMAPRAVDTTQPQHEGSPNRIGSREPDAFRRQQQGTAIGNAFAGRGFRDQASIRLGIDGHAAGENEGSDGPILGPSQNRPLPIKVGFHVTCQAATKRSHAIHDVVLGRIDLSVPRILAQFRLHHRVDSQFPKFASGLGIACQSGHAETSRQRFASQLAPEVTATEDDHAMPHLSTIGTEVLGVNLASLHLTDVFQMVMSHRVST